MYIKKYKKWFASSSWFGIDVLYLLIAQLDYSVLFGSLASHQAFPAADCSHLQTFIDTEEVCLKDKKTQISLCRLALVNAGFVLQYPHSNSWIDHFRHVVSKNYTEKWAERWFSFVCYCGFEAFWTSLKCNIICICCKRERIAKWRILGQTLCKEITEGHSSLH